MKKRFREALTVIVAVVAVLVIVWASFQLERYKARIWAEEIRRAVQP